MKNISLIADSGIQFLEFKVNFDENSKALKLKQEISFIVEDGEEIFIRPKYDEENDCYVDTDNPQQKIEEHNITTIKAKHALSCFEGQWLPLPIFTQNHNATKKKYDNGPFAWCRIWIGQSPSENRLHTLLY